MKIELDFSNYRIWFKKRNRRRHIRICKKIDLASLKKSNVDKLNISKLETPLTDLS